MIPEVVEGVAVAISLVFVPVLVAHERVVFEVVGEGVEVPAADDCTNPKGSDTEVGND